MIVLGDTFLHVALARELLPDRREELAPKLIKSTLVLKSLLILRHPANAIAVEPADTGQPDELNT